MKYLKSIHESLQDDTYITVLNTFDKYIEDGICQIQRLRHSIQVYFNFNPVYSSMGDSKFDNFEQINVFLQKQESFNSFLKSLKGLLDRLKRENLDWSITLKSGRVVIDIFQKEIEFSLKDCFYDEDNEKLKLDYDSLKKYFKEKYNVHIFNILVQNRGVIDIDIKGNILDNKELLDDLDKVVVINKVTSWNSSGVGDVYLRTKKSKNVVQSNFLDYENHRNATTISISDRLSKEALQMQRLTNSKLPKPGFTIKQD